MVAEGATGGALLVPEVRVGRWWALGSRSLSVTGSRQTHNGATRALEATNGDKNRTRRHFVTRISDHDDKTRGQRTKKEAKRQGGREETPLLHGQWFNGRMCTGILAPW